MSLHIEEMLFVEDCIGRNPLIFRSEIDLLPGGLD
jgi:hypothetical protein